MSQQHSTFKKSISKVVFAILLLALISGAAYGAWKLFNKSEPMSSPKEPITEPFPPEAPIQIKPEEVTPTPKIDISHWKIYRNEEYGFELKYPSEWVVEEANSYIIFRGEQETGLGEYLIPPFISISIDDNHEGLSIEEFYDGDPGTSYFGPGSSTSYSDQIKLITITQRKIFISCPVVTFAGGCDFIIPFKVHFLIFSTFAGYSDIELLMIKSLKASSDF